MPLAGPVLANGATRPEHSGMLSFQRAGLTWLTALALTAASTTSWAALSMRMMAFPK